MCKWDASASAIFPFSHRSTITSDACCFVCFETHSFSVATKLLMAVNVLIIVVTRVKSSLFVARISHGVKVTKKRTVLVSTQFQATILLQIERVYLGAVSVI